ncbi:MAG TPA: beta-ketoacyl synthase N-terminal-like domain-containing protein, partial [Leptospiraceae bacterium]|nr:beta-ketoacyl synthase N-terminal-like domain-containing protein [Leptospiraceae bacterium]
MPKNQRVVITGIGTVLPNAFDLENFWDNLKNGKSQIDYLTRFPTEDFAIKVGAEVRDFDYKTFLPNLDPKLAKNYNHETLVLMAAMELAQKNAKLEKDTLDPTRVGFIDSSSRSSLAWWEHAWKRYTELKDDSVFDRYAVLTSMASNPTSLTAINSNIQGFVTTISS